FIEYVETGTAPTPALRRAFERFKQWLADFYNAIRGGTGVKLSDEMRGVFDRILAGDSTFETVYGMENSLRRTGNQTYFQDAPKREGVKRNEPKRDPRLEPVKSKNPNLEISRKARDTSNDTRMMDYINSPNIVAERHAKFDPFYHMGVEAQAEQERARADWNRAVDKIYGKPGFLGRKGGLVPEAKHKDFDAILVDGDALRKAFSNKELAERGADANMIKAYRLVRRLYDNAHRLLNAQRKKYGMDEITYLDGYVPHFFHSWRVMRDGKILTSFRSMAEAVNAAEDMLKDNKDNKSPGGKLRIVPALDDFGGQAKIDAVTLGDMQYFKLSNSVAEAMEMTVGEARDFLSQNDVARMRNRSRVFKNAWQRKGYAGFDTDMEYALRHYLNLSARYLAMNKLKHNGINLFERTFGRFGNDHKGLARYAKNFLNDVLGNPSNIEETLNRWIRESWVGEHIPDWIGDRPATMGANMLAGVVAQAKLGVLNVSAGLMNLTQLNGTQAIIGPIYTARGMAEYLRPTLATRRLYREAGIEENISMENPSGYSRAHNLRGALAGASMSVFRSIDGMTRKTTLIGAYRKALADGKSRAEAIEYAKKVNDDVNFDYSVADTPEFIRRAGPIGTLLFQFKKYGIKQAELGLPFVGKLKGAEQARFWAGQLLLSGLVGLPGFELIKNIFKWMFDDDIEMEMKKMVSESPLPPALKKTVLYGALANAGVDIGRRVGMGDFIPSELSDFAGPTAGTAAQLARALPKIIDDGNFIDAIEAISPGLANPIKAFLTGETRDKWRGRTKFRYETTGEKIARASGARPIRESVESDAVRLARYEAQKKTDRETDAIDDFVREVEKESWGSPEYKAASARLGELGIAPARVMREIATRRAGTEYERRMKEARTPKRRDEYELLERFGGMGRE
ncbi:MAG: hypothetical protein LBR71_02110, partial [Synergistaceae bacterium]|nr:hypothetical protein [Synergistaceae bacterium]